MIELPYSKSAPSVHRLAEIIESETENFMKKDPDPFDERHPSRTDPECALGHALKVMFKKDNFMTKVFSTPDKTSSSSLPC